MLKKIETQPRMGRSLIDHDPRNRDYPTRGVLHDPSAPIITKVWSGHYPYDQGQNPWCVAYSGKGMLNRQPFSKNVPYRYRYFHSFEKFYRGAQANDEWPGENYDGTSGRGLLRYLSSVGVISEYRWCFGLEDVLRTVSHWGPVSVGTYWTSEMENLDNQHRAFYKGYNLGGHQWTIIGLDAHRKEVIAMNSWGRGWGNSGRFNMPFGELEQALQDEGDAYTLVTVNQPKPVLGPQ